MKRYRDLTKEYPVSELIQELLVRYQPPIIGQIDSKLSSILRNTQRERRNSTSAQDNPLDAQEEGELIRIMEITI